MATVQPPRQIAAARRDRRAARSPARTTDVVILRRNHREDRHQEIQDHQRRLQHVRAADAALGSQRRHGHPEHRSLHDPAAGHLQSEGRADAVPADPVLPDEGRRPRDRIPHPDLRRVDASAARSIHNAFFWAISRSQDATFLYDWFSKTGTGGGGEYRLQPAAAATDGQHRASTCSTSGRDHVHASDGATDTLPGQQATPSTASANQHLSVQPARARPRQLLLEHHDQPDVQHQRQRSPPSTIATTAAMSSARWGTYSLNAHIRSHRKFLQRRRSPYVYGRLAQHHVDPKRTAAVLQNSPLYFCGDRRGRAPRSSTKPGRRRWSTTARSAAAISLRRSAIRSRSGSGSPSIRPSSWRETYYTRSLDPIDATCRSTTSLNRQFFTCPAQTSGRSSPASGTRRTTATPSGSSTRSNLLRHRSERRAIDQLDRIIVRSTASTDRRRHDERHLRPQQPALRQAQGRHDAARRRRSWPSISLSRTTRTRGVARGPRVHDRASGRRRRRATFRRSRSNVRVTPTHGDQRPLTRSSTAKYRQLGRCRPTAATTGRRAQTSVELEQEVFHSGLRGFNDPSAARSLP